MNVLNVLKERGFIENTTHDDELKDYLDKQQATCYIGFDPTASSLHVGSLIPIMALCHMQKCGHRIIALVGGGTALIGDPSGKTEMRNMLTTSEIEKNADGIKLQLSHFIDFSKGNAELLNNASWLEKEKYIEFLRDIGRHFSVNRMIKAESYKMRLDSEEGLSFIEFNYMLLQAYDFLKLFEMKECCIQMGGSDQWGNIVAGIELVRKKCKKTVFGITFPLITTSSGSKMGKTAKGAVWLDAEKTIPYDYFQFWVNTHDEDVCRFLALFTFLPLNEINNVEKLSGQNLNNAKAILAFEATKIAHSENAAIKAFETAQNNFGLKTISSELLPSSTIPRNTSIDMFKPGGMPHLEMNMKEFDTGIPVFKVFQMVGLSKSRGEARRLIEQGGGYINNNRIEAFDYEVDLKDFHDGVLLLRAGKKKYFQIILKKD